jgi:hypothetical protein
MRQLGKRKRAQLPGRGREFGQFVLGPCVLGSLVERFFRNEGEQRLGERLFRNGVDQRLGERFFRNGVDQRLVERFFRNDVEQQLVERGGHRWRQPRAGLFRPSARARYP